MKYRKKPVVIDAKQFTGIGDQQDSFAMRVGEEVQVFLVYRYPGKSSEPFLEIKTLEGVMRAEKGDWVIRGVKGEFYPCKPDIFEATYEKA